MGVVSLNSEKSYVVKDSKSADCKIVDFNSLSLLSEDRLKILKCISVEPKYPAQVARELNLQVQTVYYHMRILESSKLIDFVESEEKGGATAKKFISSASSFAVIANESSWVPFVNAKFPKPPVYLEPFLQSGVFNAKFVLGSTEPHGKYRGRANDLSATELSMYLGNFSTFNYPLYLLDTELKEKHKKDNIVLIGGPKVNTLVLETNSHFPIQFDEKSFSIKSKLSGKTYEENVGVLQIIDNPFNKSKKILLVAGTNQNSTRMAVLALTKHSKRISEGNHYSPTVFANVIEGFDEDGDGIVDQVEFLE